jgi:hypothetical protein
MRTLNIIGVTGVEFTAVWDMGAGEVMFFDSRFKGDAERGTRRQDRRSVDGQFVSSYLSGVLIQRGDHSLDLYGGESEWTIPAVGMAKVRRWLRCGISGTYSTARENGMEFIGGRWVFAGDKGYRVVPDGDIFRVVSYAGGSERPVYLTEMTQDAAHDAAWDLAYGRK